MTDWGSLYRDHVDSLAALGPMLTKEQLATTVPATPLWTVHEALAHIAGGGNDAMTGRMDGAPSPQWTSRHVGERRDTSVDDLIAELRSNEDAIAAALEGDQQFPALAFDIAVHHTDVHEALGLHRIPERLWAPIAEAMAPRAQALADAVSPYDLFRAAFSRRSRSQMQSWGTGLSAEQLDEVCIFGPREDDQPIPT